MDLTTLATPFYFGTMAVEHRRLARRAASRGAGAGDYTRPDTLASLSMGVGSLLLPSATRRLVGAFAPGRGRWARRLLAATAATALATTVADRVVRRSRGTDAGAVPVDADDVDAVAGTRTLHPHGEDPAPRWATSVQRVGGVSAVAGATVLATATAAHRTTAGRMWARGRRHDLGTGPAGWLAAIAGWDLIYYWNHRFMHEVRLLWAHHVVHHSSERYNLSTALRQPVSPFGVWVPYGLLSRFGVRPSLVERARDVNLLYQYWVHTETIDRLGAGEEVLNTPSHHRVHHGSNRRYLDRNHGGILITWDRLFGTFEREDPAEPVVYGLTSNIGSFHPVRIVGHEYVDMVRDVAASDNWRDRLSFVVRGPGWAHRRRVERATPAPVPAVVQAAS